MKLPVPAVDQSAVAKRGFFYVGGHYVGEAGKHIMQGQIYVEVLAPKEQRRPYPLVLIHGAAQTATNWMGTPDGREGWAEYFVEQGYVVYMIDQPMRGRSAYHPGDGATRMFTTENEEFQFTAIETTAPGRDVKSTRNSRAVARIRASRATLCSTRSTQRRSKPCCRPRRPNSAIRMPARRCSTRLVQRSC
ncbi:MAG TPA: hypothetical protein VIJ04_08380 [Xanthobacteraceae bacterium]